MSRILDDDFAACSKSHRRRRSRALACCAAFYCSALCIAFTGAAHAWRREVDATKSNYDTARAVAVDGAGDVIAVGELQTRRFDRDFTVIKFSGSSGDEVWRREIDGTTVDTAQAVAVDGAGDVIAVGRLGRSGIGIDLAVMKLAGDTGSELWRQEIYGSADALYVYDLAEAVALTSTCDVVVAGQLVNVGALSDFTVIKFSGARGAELWRRELRGTGWYYRSSAHDVVVDRAGDVFAVGELGNLGTRSDFSVVKLAGGTGAELWRQQIDEGGGDAVAQAVAMDGNGDVIAAGAVAGLGGSDFAVIKFSGSTGAEQWRRIIDGSSSRPSTDFAQAVAVDSTGDVIAGGLLYNAETRQDFVVVKLSGDTGKELWRQERDGTATRYDRSNRDSVSDRDSVSAVIVDDNDDVIAVGTLDNRPSERGRYYSEFDFAVIKLAGRSGKEIWRQEIGGTDKFPSGSAAAVAADKSGDVVVAGQLDNSPTDEDLAVVKLDGESGAIGSPVYGSRLRVDDERDDPEGRKIFAVLKDFQIKLPLPGSADDPRTAGGSLRLVNESTGETASFLLPAGPEWKGLGNPPGSAGYRYRDGRGKSGPCRILTARPGRIDRPRRRARLSAVCTGRRGSIPFTLDELRQGGLTISIQLGSSSPHCAIFDAGTIRQDFGTINPGPKGLFRAVGASRRSGACPRPVPRVAPSPMLREPCAGDCDQNRDVSALELFTLTCRSVFGCSGNGPCHFPPMCSSRPDCSAGDTKVDGMVSAVELFRATDNSVQGCCRQ